MTRSGDNVILISDGEGTASHPRWSPDGRQIAFLLEAEDGNTQVFLSNVEDPQAHRITVGDFTEGPPAWSPDGKWIAFSLSDSDGDGQGIVLRNPGGVNQITLTDGPGLQSILVPGVRQHRIRVFPERRPGHLCHRRSGRFLRPASPDYDQSRPRPQPRIVPRRRSHRLYLRT